MDYPWSVRGKKVALFFAGGHNIQPRWNTFGVT
jgi:hypothetical protein